MVFVAGCVAGLLCFSKLLNCLFDRFKNITMALLTGILLGSLNKVWPWKETLTTRINSNGEQVADQQQNISPFIYQQMTGSDSYVLSACVFALVGAGLVLILEKVNR
jgi:putative membrane protein